MGKIVFVGLCHLRTSFGTYEQFIHVYLSTMFVSFKVGVGVGVGVKILFEMVPMQHLSSQRGRKMQIKTITFCSSSRLAQDGLLGRGRS